MRAESGARHVSEVEVFFRDRAKPLIALIWWKLLVREDRSGLVNGCSHFRHRPVHMAGRDCR